MVIATVVLSVLFFPCLLQRWYCCWWNHGYSDDTAACGTMGTAMLLLVEPWIQRCCCCLFLGICCHRNCSDDSTLFILHLIFLTLYIEKIQDWNLISLLSSDVTRILTDYNWYFYLTFGLCIRSTWSLSFRFSAKHFYHTTRHCLNYCVCLCVCVCVSVSGSRIGLNDCVRFYFLLNVHPCISL